MPKKNFGWVRQIIIRWQSIRYLIIYCLANEAEAQTKDLHSGERPIHPAVRIVTTDVAPLAEYQCPNAAAS